MGYLLIAVVALAAWALEDSMSEKEKKDETLFANRNVRGIDDTHRQSRSSDKQHHRHRRVETKAETKAESPPEPKLETKPETKPEPKEEPETKEKAA